MKFQSKILLSILVFLTFGECSSEEYNKIDKLIFKGLDNTKVDLKSFSAFKNVTELTIRDTLIFDLTNLGDSVANIKILEITQSNAKYRHSINIDFSQFKSLKKLTISGFRIEKLPLSILCLKKLEYLDLSNNAMSGFDLAIDAEFSEEGLDKIGVFSNMKNLKELKLAKNYLEYLDSSVFDLEFLEHLDLSNNNFFKIPLGVNKLKRLSCLNLSFNFLSEINDLDIDSLSFLYLRDNDLSSLPEDMCKFNSLIHLDVAHNCLKDLPIGMSIMLRLNCLNLSFNKLTFIPSCIFALGNLKYLNLGNNQITNILPTIEESKKAALDFSYFKSKVLENEASPFSKNSEDIRDCLEIISFNLSQLSTNQYDFYGIYNLGELCYLNLSNNLIRDIPLNITFCKKLQEIDLSGNRIEFVFYYISKLKDLKRLNLSSNKIKNISRLNYFKNLEKLNLSNNKLSSFRVFTESISSLVDINLSDNFITELLPGYMNFPNLKTFNVSNNKLSDFNIGDNGKNTLKYLDLSKNSFETVPQFLSSLSNLYELDLSSNYLSNFDFSIFQNNPIEKLNLSENNIREINFGSMPLESLKTLDLSANFIFSILGIEVLNGLTTLNLHSNDLESLPKGMTKMKNLRRLNISLNFLTKTKKKSWICSMKSDVNHNQYCEIDELKNLRIKEFLYDDL